jgi:hypothetical protein
MLSPLLLSVALFLPSLAGEEVRENSIAAKDMKGFETSLYRGEYYSPKYDACRQAIMWRESRYNYRAANPTSSARGAYQFLDKSWRRGLTFMFVKESKQTGDGLISEARALREIPIHKWSRYWQDRAFFTAYNHGKGAHHWNPLPSAC